MGNCSCLPKPNPDGEKVTDWIRRRFKTKKNCKVDAIVAAVIANGEREDEKVKANSPTTSSDSLTLTIDESSDGNESSSDAAYVEDCDVLDIHPSSPFPCDVNQNIVADNTAHVPESVQKTGITRYTTQKSSQPISPLCLTQDQLEAYKITRAPDIPLPRVVEPPINPIAMGIMMRRMIKKGIKPQVRAITILKEEDGVSAGVLDMKVDIPQNTTRLERPHQPTLGVRQLQKVSNCTNTRDVHEMPGPIQRSTSNTTPQRPLTCVSRALSLNDIREINTEPLSASDVKAPRDENARVAADKALEEKFLKYVRTKSSCIARSKQHPARLESLVLGSVHGKSLLNAVGVQRSSESSEEKKWS